MGFIQFWLECICEGFKFSFETFGALDGCCVVITAILYWKRKHHQKFWEEKGEPFVKKWALPIIAVQFVTGVFFVAPYARYYAEKKQKETAQKSLEDKSPHLDGFVNRSFFCQENGTTNTLAFLEVTIDNSGGAPTYADGYELKVILSTNLSVKAEPVHFKDEYTYNFIQKSKLWMLDLKRPQLIAEKTIRPITVGEPKRGWTAFRLRGLPIGSFQFTNLVMRFSDINGKTSSVTNGFWKGVLNEPITLDDLVSTDPDAENIFYPIARPSGWLPPELPPDCSNVVVAFGAKALTYSRFMASIDPENGTKFSIKDVPDYFLAGVESNPDYSPRQPDIFLKYYSSFSIGGKTVPYPVHPVIISNRLYVEAEIPFSNERHTIIMNDSFDSKLSIPKNWDRNYSTNYDDISGMFYYEIVNELKNPVLQVAYIAPNTVVVNGIFQTDSNSFLAAFGEQPILFTMTFTNTNTTNGMVNASLQAENFHEVLTIRSNETIATFGQRLTNEFFRPIFKYQRPIFKYPSNKYPGVFQNWETQTNTTVTKTHGHSE